MESDCPSSTSTADSGNSENKKFSANKLKQVVQRSKTGVKMQEKLSIEKWLLRVTRGLQSPPNCELITVFRPV